MYQDDDRRTVGDEAELWPILLQHLEVIEDALFHTAVEIEEEALGLIDDEEARSKRVGLSAIRYRGVSSEADQLNYFLEIGRELFPQVASAVRSRQLTPDLVQQWGVLQFCHGYVAAHIFDDTDPMAAKRGGQKRGRQVSKDQQRKWLAHLILRLRGTGLTRTQAEDRAVEIINSIRSAKTFPPGFDDHWYASMITHGGLAATYDNKHFPVKQMKALVEEPTDDIPPIPEIT